MVYRCFTITTSMKISRNMNPLLGQRRGCISPSDVGIIANSRQAAIELWVPSVRWSLYSWVVYDPSSQRASPSSSSCIPWKETWSLANRIKHLGGQTSPVQFMHINNANCTRLHAQIHYLMVMTVL